MRGRSRGPVRKESPEVPDQGAAAVMGRKDEWERICHGRIHDS